MFFDSVTIRDGSGKIMTNGGVEEKVADLLRDAGQTIAVAESCTGGLICHRLTNVSGSSEYLEMGVIAYSNRVKTSLLGVPEAVIADHGAVSEACVRAMAAGVRGLAGTHIGLAVSGIAGPTGGTAEKPVGTVYVGLAGTKGETGRHFSFNGSRLDIKEESATEALRMVSRYFEGGGSE